MKRRYLLQMLMMVIMMAMVNNSFAQGRRGRSAAGRGANREIVMNSNGGFRMTRSGGHEMNRPSNGHEMNRPSSGHAMNRHSGGGHEMNRHSGGGHEMNRHSGGGHEMSRHFGGGHEMNRHFGGHGINRPGGHEMARHHGGAPRVDHRGFVPGWEGRVRHHNGRWGYFRDNRWFWYDRYFDPVYYFGSPLAYFNDYYYIADGGYIPGWEGRVRYDRGRWGYYRAGRWLWYDRYYAPDYYFAHPVRHFRHHVCGPVAAGIAGGIVGGAVLGTLIGALCR